MRLLNFPYLRFGQAQLSCKRSGMLKWTIQSFTTRIALHIAIFRLLTLMETIALTPAYQFNPSNLFLLLKS